MRLLIFGSRASVPAEVVREFVRTLPSHATVITGGAQGVDLVAFDIAYQHWAVKALAGAELVPAMWDVYGNGAGPERNSRMVAACDLGIGFRAAGRSRGTDDMARRLDKSGKLLGVVTGPEWDWRSLVPPVLRGA